MNTLMAPPLAPLLAQIFADADVTEATLEQQLENFSPEELDALKGGPGNYRELYARMKDTHLAVSRDTGLLLYMLVRFYRSAFDYRIRDFLRCCGTASCRRSQGQRWRPPHQHRV